MKTGSVGDGNYHGAVLIFPAAVPTTNPEGGEILRL